MKIRTLFLLLAISFISSQISAQSSNWCPTNTVLPSSEEMASETSKESVLIEKRIRQILSNNPDFRVSGGIVTIPVVFHVVYNSESENVSKEDLLREIENLNIRFRKLNPDTTEIPNVWASTMADAEIEFCLATKDPKGLPHSGIERRKTWKRSFGFPDSDLKFWERGGLDSWPQNDYLNFWVCNLNSVGGYGTFPGLTQDQDGIVCRYGTIGYDYSLSAHEVGHWLNLYHIWGDCGINDGVADTPPQGSPSLGCHTFPYLESCSPNYPGCMYMNYMDYSSCRNTFTNGQVARMHAALAGPRSAILISNKCTPNNLFQHDAAISGIRRKESHICQGVLSQKVEIANLGTDFLRSVSVNYQLDNEPIESMQWDDILMRSLDRIIFSLPDLPVAPGPHILKVWTSAPNGQADQQPSNDLDTLHFNAGMPLSGLETPVFENFEHSHLFPPDWNMENQDGWIRWVIQTDLSANGIGSSCIGLNNFSSLDIGTVDYIQLPAFNLRTLPYAKISFDMAYQLRFPGDVPDTLKVQISTDCGLTWNNLYRNWCSSMTTTVPYGTSVPFIPSPSDWRTESFSFAEYQDFDYVLLRIAHTYMGGNNLYIDNITVGRDVVLKEEAQVIIHPNPVKDRLRIWFPSPMSDWKEVRIYNSLGQLMISNTISPSCPQAQLIDVSNLKDGVYVMEALGKDRRISKKFIKLR